MAAFDYVALDDRGRRHKGVIEADSPRQTRQILRERKLAAVTVTEAAQRPAKGRDTAFRPRRRRLRQRELSQITRQLATLIQAGLPVEKAVQALGRQSDNPAARSILAAVRARVVEGHSLSEGLGAFPESFSELFRASVHAGERTGRLGPVLEHLASFAEHSDQAGQKILLALLYPAILTGVSLLIMIFLLTTVMPDMLRVFSGAESLPLLTRAVMAFSHGLQSLGPILVLALAAAGLYARRMLRRAETRLALDRRILRWPVVGRLASLFGTARFASTLGMLHESGVPLVQGLEIAASVQENRHLRSAARDVARKVGEGRSLSAALEESGVYPPVLTTMAASGEASGRLGDMLTRAGDALQRDYEARVAVLLGLFEPLVLLVMGLVVLLLVLAIIQPIVNLNQLVN